MSEAMRLGDRRQGVVKVTTVRLGDGCQEYCSSCGAYPDTEEEEDLKRALTMLEVDRARIEACLLSEVANGEGSVEAVVATTKLRIVDLLANYVTTDVNQEPLNGDSFIHFAELVKLLSGDKSRAVCISHGLRAGAGGKIDEDVEERLNRIVKMMDERDVFVLSLDMARSWGKIGHEVNVSSYMETLDRLRPALKKGARITISIQGDDDKNSPLYRGKAFDLCTEVLNKLEGERGWTREERIAVNIDSGRAWVKAGRAEVLPGVGPNGECAVVPDHSFVTHTLDVSHTLMAVVDAVSGGVYVHDHNPKKTYNDVVRLSKILSDLRIGRRPVKWEGWQEACVNRELFPDLTGEFAEALTRRVHGRLAQVRGAAAGGPGRTNTLPGIGLERIPEGVEAGGDADTADGSREGGDEDHNGDAQD